MKIIIDNAFILSSGELKSLQAYILELDLMDNTIENVKLWDETFIKLMGKRLKLIIEEAEE